MGHKPKQEHGFIWSTLNYAHELWLLLRYILIGEVSWISSPNNVHATEVIIKNDHI